MSKSEKNIETTLRLEVKKLGGWALKMLSTHISGLPDRICLFKGGRVLFVELKSTGKKPTQIQIIVHNKLRGLGFRVEVIDNITDLKNILKEYE